MSNKEEEEEVGGSSPRLSSPLSLAAFNQKNPGIRRILADARELAREPSDQYVARPGSEENMFEWHFVIRGPKGSDFEGGRYHGKILLPSEYPFKPPNIVFLTPNGRWETKTKICLSMSSYHPEEWQPAWGIRTMLEALISFMPSPGDGALGAIELSSEARKKLAQESLLYEHPHMPELPELGSCSYVQPKEVQEAVLQLKMVAKKEEEVDTKSTPAEEAVVVGGGGEEEGEATVRPVTVVPAAGQEVDRIDEFLRVTSYGILFLLFALVYRKLLILYAPDM